MKKIDEYGLMMGDFVLAQYLDEDSEPIYTAPVRVSGIDENGTLCGEDWHFVCAPLVHKDWPENIDCLYGIPLTEEILKANEFQSSSDGRSISFFSEEDEPLFTISIRQGGYWIPVSWCGKGITLKYVHELQHALRLCGLNELANNFKIE